MPIQTMMPEMLKMLHDCAAMCEHTVHVLLQRQDAHLRRHQIKLLNDCASICHLCARSISSHSPVMKAMCDFCAYVCDVCGHECLRHNDHESQMCGQMCLACARDCRAFAMAA